MRCAVSMYAMHVLICILLKISEYMQCTLKYLGLVQIDTGYTKIERIANKIEF